MGIATRVAKGLLLHMGALNELGFRNLSRFLAGESVTQLKQNLTAGARNQLIMFSRAPYNVDLTFALFHSTFHRGSLTISAQDQHGAKTEISLKLKCHKN